MIDLECVQTACLIINVLPPTYQNLVGANIYVSKVASGHSFAIIRDFNGFGLTHPVLTVVYLEFELILLELEALDFIPLVCNLLCGSFLYGHYLLELFSSSDIVFLLLKSFKGVEVMLLSLFPHL
jgi:hypothetical protein